MRKLGEDGTIELAEVAFGLFNPLSISVGWSVSLLKTSSLISSHFSSVPHVVERLPSAGFKVYLLSKLLTNLVWQDGKSLHTLEELSTLVAFVLQQVGALQLYVAFATHSMIESTSESGHAPHVLHARNTHHRLPCCLEERVFVLHTL